MAFSQIDIDPIYLREQHKQNTTEKPKPETKRPEIHILKQLFLKNPVTDEKKTKNITTDPINRLISFHL